MKKIYTAAVAAVLCCTASLASCGKDAPAVEEPISESSMVAVGGEPTSSASEEEKTEAPESSEIPETSESSEIPESSEAAESSEVSEAPRDPASKANNAGGSENFSAVTRSPEDLENISNGSQTEVQPGAVSGITLSYYEAELFPGQTKEYPCVTETIQEIWTTSDPNVATVDDIGNITAVGEGSCVIRVVSENDSTLGAEVKVTVKSSEGTVVEDGITYIDGILIANKSYSLPQSYNPGGLTAETNNAFYELANGASADGLNIYISSGFRSYEYQEQIYNNYVSIYGQETADTFSARPGYSEHQTGLAIDVNEISDAFIGTPEAIWLEEHCYEYGFIIRYPYGKKDITGYKYEPWHIRYVGKEFAAAFKAAADEKGDQFLTLEEYFGIDSYYH